VTTLARLRRTADLPRINSERATHTWKIGYQDANTFLGVRAVWTCADCDQIHAMHPDGRPTVATGCARPRFTGLYRPGDHVDALDASGVLMRYVFVRYTGRRRVLLHACGFPDEFLACPAGGLLPVLAGRAEAEKRRLAYLKRQAEKESTS
jgi:hypothetical protein